LSEAHLFRKTRIRERARRYSWLWHERRRSTGARVLRTGADGRRTNYRLARAAAVVEWQRRHVRDFLGWIQLAASGDAASTSPEGNPRRGRDGGTVPRR